MNTIKQHANNLRAFSDTRVAWNSANLLEMMGDLLKVARCPNRLCKDGVIPHGPDPDGNWEVEQCQWCHERSQLLGDNFR